MTCSSWYGHSKAGEVSLAGGVTDVGTVADERLKTVLTRLSGMPVGLDRVLLGLGRPTSGIDGDVFNSKLVMGKESEIIGVVTEIAVSKLKVGDEKSSDATLTLLPRSVVERSVGKAVRPVPVMLGNTGKEIEGLLKLKSVWSVVDASGS